jgi:hypothetical protein
LDDYNDMFNLTNRAGIRHYERLADSMRGGYGRARASDTKCDSKKPA